MAKGRITMKEKAVGMITNFLQSYMSWGDACFSEIFMMLWLESLMYVYEIYLLFEIPIFECIESAFFFFFFSLRYTE